MKRFPLPKQALAMGLLWLVITAYLHPALREIGWVTAVLLLAAAVVVPLGLEQALRSSEGGIADRLLGIAAKLHWAAVPLLALSVLWSPGPTAALAALPWLAVTGLITLAGLARLWRRRFLPLEELCFDAGLVYLAVGGGWTVLAWGGLRPLGFAVPIVLLTAVHFHYAGFALPLLTGLAGRTLGSGTWTRTAALGVIAGVPLVAVGITASQLGQGPLLEGAAAVVTALGGLLTAGLSLRLAAQPGRAGLIRALWGLSALALAAGMILAALYGLRTWVSIAWLDLPWMWALHGTANSLGFAIPGLAAWELLRTPRPSSHTMDRGR
jgi:YndJ-like protein